MGLSPLAEEHREVVYAGLIFMGASALYTLLAPPSSLDLAGSSLLQADSLSVDGNQKMRSASLNLRQSIALQFAGIAASVGGSVLATWGAIEDDDSKLTNASYLAIAGVGLNLLANIMFDRAGRKLKQTASMMER